MISLQEALARERIHEMRRSARETRATSESLASRRKRRLQRLARSVHPRS
jgi:hypothetical protein